MVSALEMGVGPLFIALMMLLQKQSVRKLQWLIAIGTFIACLFLIVAVLVGVTGVALELSPASLIGLIASVLCGIGSVHCSIYKFFPLLDI